MNVLVTGSTGMLGSALCGLLEKKHKVLGVSRSGRNGLACDLSNPDAFKLFEDQSIGLVVHTAAYSDVDGCERDPKLAYETNVLAPKYLAAFCDQKKIPWIHVSTDYVFDGRKGQPYEEKDRTMPISIYGITKWIAEFYAKNSASPCAIVRTSWLFGPNNPKTFVNVMAKRIQADENVSVLDNQTTCPTSVKDLSLAIERIAEFLLKQPSDKKFNEVFHVCNRGGTTHLGIARAIRDLLGKTKIQVEKTDVSKIMDRVAIRPTPSSEMRTDRFEKTFGMKMRPWQDSLKEYVQKECAS